MKSHSQCIEPLYKEILSSFYNLLLFDILLLFPRIVANLDMASEPHIILQIDTPPANLPNPWSPLLLL